MFKYYLTIIICLAIPHTAYASQGMIQPECAIEGVVIEEAKRIEQGRGMSTGKKFTYNDVTIKITKSELAETNGQPNAVNTCDVVGKTTTFQRRNKPLFFSKLTGKCISVKNRWSGDGNFMSGNWIYDIITLEESDCN